MLSPEPAGLALAGAACGEPGSAEASAVTLEDPADVDCPWDAAHKLRTVIARKQTCATNKTPLEEVKRPVTPLILCSLSPQAYPARHKKGVKVRRRLSMVLINFSLARPDFNFRCWHLISRRYQYAQQFV